ncbi:MAG: N-6 DNA methylase [Corynebacterium sp.]|uniref:N-6 DNA methylase n=1 Tax=Corynebacterium sp. TaxID=1720 RepID=UPI0026E10882|nr:N-6 DNA methylase [Corynebacterium sp.]MDO5670036.1 N-6 DNA methylase [Corynebacterium sp.]
MTTSVLRGSDTFGARKKRGAFFTPAPIADLLVNECWASDSRRILEPSCGEAAFLLSAGEKSAGEGRLVELHGVELHEESAAHARALLKAKGHQARIRVDDFFDVPGSADFDLVIGNPPYIRFHDHSGESRHKAREAAAAGGVEINELASSWAAFVVHSTTFLTTGGTLGMVLPAELLYTGYAAPIRALLLREFAAVKIIIVENNVFAGAQEQVLLVIGAGFGTGSGTELKFRTLESEKWRTFTPASPEARWTDIFGRADTRSMLNGAVATESLVPLITWGSVRLGAVTGANAFFTMTPAEARELAVLPEETVALSPPGSVHLRNLEFSKADWVEQGARGAATILFRPSETPSPGALRKIAEGEEAGIDQRYKCRVRKPWWQTPLPEVPDLLLTYMNLGTPQLATNSARVNHINSVHGVYITPELRELAAQFLPLAALNSATATDAELSGRSYGGGLLKLEPGEARRWLLPSPVVVASLAQELSQLKEKVRGCLHGNDLDGAMDVVDEVLLPRLGFSPREAEALRRERIDLKAKRMQRSKGSRT